MSTICFICNTDPIEKVISDHRKDSITLKCPRCGVYILTSTLRSILENQKEINQDWRYRLSSWLREQTDSEAAAPELDSSNFKELKKLPDISLREKFKKFMLLLKTITKDESWDITTSISALWSKCWVKDELEMNALLEKAIKEHYIVAGQRAKDVYHIDKITFEGLEYLESINVPNALLRQVFVAYWFSDEMFRIYDDHIVKAVREAGFDPVDARVSNDKTERKIDDEIVSFIKGSKFLIADFTNNRGAVYFEAGFAMGMGLPIIWACKDNKDDVDKLCFDTRQYPHIIWKDGRDFYQKLLKRIKARF